MTVVKIINKYSILWNYVIKVRGSSENLKKFVNFDPVSNDEALTLWSKSIDYALWTKNWANLFSIMSV